MEGHARRQTLDEMLLERFARKNPIAASTRLVLEQLFASDAINAVFEKNRVEQYTSKILFVTIVQVMLAVVTGKVDSAHAAMKRHGDSLGASVTAFYNKLNGTEPQVATALVAHSNARAAKASCASREIENSRASTSAVSPMLSCE